MFELVDGNNSYVSCERVFRPSLRGKPVISLSNNDGCAIARSNEAKALGIKMGDPWFKIKHLENKAGLIALSANFALYGDMSNRMMSIAAGLGPTQEIYSIDESFIGLDGVRGDLVKRSWAIRSRILQWTGLPCGIGIGPTKTLAKLANQIAKTAERMPGSYPEKLAVICNLAVMPPSEMDAWFAATEVGTQSELDFEATEMRDRSRLMSAVDTINARFGRGSIHVGSAVGVGERRDWSMKQERLTPQYTTKWSDMPVVRA